MDTVEETDAADQQMESSAEVVVTSWQASLPAYRWSEKSTIVAEVDARAESTERNDNFFRTAKW